MTTPSLRAKIHELAETARTAILDGERLLAEAPKLSADDHISLHVALEDDIAAIRSAVRKIVQADSKALTDRWGTRQAADPNQMTLDQHMAAASANGESLPPRPSDIPGETEEIEGADGRAIYGGTIVEAPPQARDADNLRQFPGSTPDETPAPSAGRRGRQKAKDEPQAEEPAPEAEESAPVTSEAADPLPF